MKQTPNINLPILEQGDKYLKETQNEAFSVIDREIAGLNSAISVLDNVEGSIISTKSDVETLKNETNTLKASLNDMVGNVIPNIQTSLEHMRNSLSVFVDDYILPTETNHTRGIKEAIIISEKENKTLEFLSGKKYVVTDTLTFNIGTMKIKGNKCTLDFTNLEKDKVAIIITNNSDGYKNQGSYFEGFEIIGNGQTNGSVAIKIKGSNQTNSATHFNINKLNISNFQKGIEYGNYTYCISHTNLDISYCDICVDMISGQADYGENINFTSCATYNSNIAFKISNSLGAFNLTNISIDYCNKFFDINGGRVFVNNSHIEGGGTFEINGGNGSVLNINNSWLVLKSTSDNVKFKNAISNPIIVQNCSIESDFTDTIVASGYIRFKNTTGYSTNNFASNYLDNKAIKNIRCLAKGGGTNTSQLANSGYCEISTTSTADEFETGSNGIKVYKKWGQGSSSTLQILVPLDKDCNYNNLKIRMKANKSYGGANISRRLNYVQVVENMSLINNIQFPKIDFLTNNGYIADLVINTEWKTFLYKNHNMVKPINSTHLLYEILLTNTTGEDYFYIDNIEINEF